MLISLLLSLPSFILERVKNVGELRMCRSKHFSHLKKYLLSRQTMQYVIPIISRHRASHGKTTSMDKWTKFRWRCRVTVVSPLLCAIHKPKEMRHMGKNQSKENSCLKLSSYGKDMTSYSGGILIINIISLSVPV